MNKDLSIHKLAKIAEIMGALHNPKSTRSYTAIPSKGVQMTQFNPKRRKTKPNTFKRTKVKKNALRWAK